MATKKPRRKLHYILYANLDRYKDRGMLPNYSPWHIFEEFATLELATKAAQKFADDSLNPVHNVRQSIGREASIRIEEDSPRFGRSTVYKFNWLNGEWTRVR
jgi:hypothetical protein